MNGNQTFYEMSLDEFITLPDTVPLVFREDFFLRESFQKKYHIRLGTKLFGGYEINYVNRDQISAIRNESGETLFTLLPTVMGLLDRQNLDAAGIIQIQQHPYLQLRGQGTLVGFIDTGIDYTLDAFKYEDGTSKIRYIWDQSIKGSPPGDFHLGTEYSQQQINDALKAENPFDIVPHRDTVGHGTFLASIAAGRESGEYIGAAPDAEVIAVKLRRAPQFFYDYLLIPQQQENAFTSSDLILGIQYILNKAAELNRPVAICIALGSNMGGHDGFNLTEEFLTRASNIAGVGIACAAGNESQAGKHTNGRIQSKNKSQNIELRVGEDAHDILIHMRNGASDRLAISIISPTGEVIPRIPILSGSSYSANLILESSRVTVEYYLPLRESGGQVTVIRIFKPTKGIWTITVYGEIVLDGSYHLYLPISNFSEPDTRFLTPTPNYTIVTPANAIGVITSGAYDSRSNSLYPNSSWGATRMPMMSPDLVSPGVDVGGIYPTGPGQMTGTSVSAAITAGACALMLQWGIVNQNDVAMTTNHIRALLIRGCRRSATLEYPNTQWGYGMLDLINSLELIKPTADPTPPFLSPHN